MLIDMICHGTGNWVKLTFAQTNYYELMHYIGERQKLWYINVTLQLSPALNNLQEYKHRFDVA